MYKQESYRAKQSSMILRVKLFKEILYRHTDKMPVEQFNLMLRVKLLKE